jgi:hypothetical protein
VAGVAVRQLGQGLVRQGRLTVPRLDHPRQFPDLVALPFVQ